MMRAPATLRPVVPGPPDDSIVSPSEGTLRREPSSEQPVRAPSTSSRATPWSCEPSANVQVGNEAMVRHPAVQSTTRTQRIAFPNMRCCSAQCGHHAAYYPGAEELSLQLVYDRKSSRLLGAQAFGRAGVDKRIDVLATAPLVSPWGVAVAP